MKPPPWRSRLSNAGLMASAIRPWIRDDPVDHETLGEGAPEIVPLVRGDPAPRRLVECREGEGEVGERPLVAGGPRPDQLPAGAHQGRPHVHGQCAEQHDDKPEERVFDAVAQPDLAVPAPPFARLDLARPLSH